MTSKKTFKTVIDTVAIKTSINNINDYTELNNDRYDFIDRLGDNFDNCEMRLKVNLNTRYGEMTLNNIESYKSALIDSLKDIGVQDMEQVKLDRIDIAIDTNDYDFKVDFKKLLFIFELLTIKRSKKSSRWYTTNLNTFKANTMKLYNSRMELEIYNKHEESNGIHPYKTRLEFRYKRLEKNLLSEKDYINKTFDIIEEMDKHLPMLEDLTSKKLMELWENEKSTVLSFSEFVRKYNQYIYTLDILKVVYKASGLKGSYNNWLKKFRKTNTIELYTKTDITELQKALKKSLKEYIK